MMQFRSSWLPSVVSGMLMTASFPKVGLSGLAWFALVPLLVALRERSTGSAFRIGMMAGLVHYLTLLYWVIITMRTYGYLPWWQCVALLVLLAAYLALYPGVFAAALIYCCRKPLHLIWIAPVFWVALDYGRSFLLSGFPWGMIGYSQFNWLHITQISDIFGVYGVSFLVVLGNACVYLLLLYAAQKAWQGHTLSKIQVLQAMVPSIVLIGAALIYGQIRIGSIDHAVDGAATHRVAVVQGNIDQAHKWDPAYQIGTTKKYLDLTRSAAAHRPDLVVWPETATPFYFESSPKLTRLVKATVRQVDVPLLVGSPSVEGQPGAYAYYNSAYIVNPQGLVTGRYDKVHLVPFGEYVPLKRLLFFVGKMVAQVGDFSAGEKGRTLPWDQASAPVGVQICFEIIFPGLSRALVQNGAGVLINLTNDAWFGRSGAAYQHFSMAVFRAIENRRSLVRCANTGISGFVDPVGRIVSRTELFEDAIVVERVPVLAGMSIYTRIGDMLPLMCLILMMAWVFYTVKHDRQMLPPGRMRSVIDAIKQSVSRMAGKRR